MHDRVAIGYGVPFSVSVMSGENKERMITAQTIDMSFVASFIQGGPKKKDAPAEQSTNRIKICQ